MVWRYIATRKRGDGTEELLDDDLPIEGLSYREDASGPGALTGSVTPEIPRLKRDELFVPHSTMIYAEGDGQLRGGGLLIDRTDNGPELQLDCVGLTGLAKGEPYKGRRSGIQVDPLDEFRHIWAHLQGQRGKNLGIEWQTTTSDIRIGKPEDPTLTLLKEQAARERRQYDIMAAAYKAAQKTYDAAKKKYEADKTDANEKARDEAKVLMDMAKGRKDHAEEDLGAAEEKVDKLIQEGGAAEPYKLNYWTNHDLGQDLDDLAAMGFDYAIDHRWDGETIRHIGLLGYPRIGKRRSEAFIVGENILEIPQVDYRGEDYASEVIVLGAGEGPKMRRGDAARSTGRLGKTILISDTNLTSHRQCQRAAERELQLRLGAPDVTSFVLENHPHAPTGTVRAGDEIQVQTRDGWNDGLDLWVRILSATVTPDDGRTVVDVTRAERV